MLQDGGEQVIIPCIAVAEYLTGIHPNDHARTIAALQKNFFCPPFDIRATDVAAKLFLDHKSIPAEEQTSRKTLKSDILIVASARTAGATTFYSHDSKSRRLAQLAGIVGKDLPTDHPDMYRNVDFKKQFGLL